ncbi:MAG TPA: DUF2330 domain-containing protein, partial [Jatrophihabitans sp.]|nr:DUF2330 domain-containing protein [Jatrophihabitans sp.]
MPRVIDRPFRRRAAVLGAATLAALLIPLAVPAGQAAACACGVYSPAHGGSAAVAAETALVRDAGNGTEDVYLSLRLDSDVRTGALLFPVPDRHATVTAGPPTLFTDLAALTAAPPTRPHAAGPGNGAAAPLVVVEHRQAIGPLDVATLWARDAGALNTWLAGHGFTPKPALATAAGAYLARGWAFVAVRLRPEAAGTARLDGQLDPLHLRFRTTDLVYPMRLSHLATRPARVTLYTLGARPLALNTTIPGMRLRYAGQVPAGAGHALATVTAAGTTYLRRYDGALAPADITGDFHFRAAAPVVTDRVSGRAPAAGPILFPDGDRGAPVAAVSVVL